MIVTIAMMMVIMTIMLVVRVSVIKTIIVIRVFDISLKRRHGEVFSCHHWLLKAVRWQVVPD